MGHHGCTGAGDRVPIVSRIRRYPPGFISIVSTDGEE
jgi:hypothetical protein